MLRPVGFVPSFSDDELRLGSMFLVANSILIHSFTHLIYNEHVIIGFKL